MGRVSWYRVGGLVVWEAFVKDAEHGWERFQKGTLSDLDGCSDEDVSHHVAVAAARATRCGIHTLG